MSESKIGENLEDIRNLLNISEPQHGLGTDYAWYVGATGEEDGVYKDYSEQFIAEGRWENGWDNKFTDLVNSVKVGDKIALKASYTKKKGLPFNNNGKTVGVMGIKAIGIVTENAGDGKHLKVDWEKVDPIKEWYGKGTLRSTIHLIKAQDGLTKKLLLKFTFEGKEQDYSMCEEQYLDEIDDENKEKQVVVDELKDDYTIEELGAILKEMYNSPDNSGKVTAIHLFGIKYGGIIKKKGYYANAIVAAAGISDSYHVEVTKGLRIYDSISDNEYGVSFYDGSETDLSESTEKKELPIRQKRSDKKHPLNTILYGPPGTGKTYSTIEYALAIINSSDVDLSEKDEDQREITMKAYNDLIDKGQIVFTTFHQNYGYEDFIQGLRPDTKSDAMSFKNVDGVFKIISERALYDYENNYVVVIDEINRANISKVFGELITLIEDDKRWGEVNQTSVTLPSGEIFTIPNNLYILGTMNSSDKSISLIDAALRRRFVFKELKPNEQFIKDATLKSMFVQLNHILSKELENSDLLIGHSYFMNKTIADTEDVFNYSVIPLLYEYFYDNRKKVFNVLSEVLKNTNYKVMDQKFGRIYITVKGDNE